MPNRDLLLPKGAWQGSDSPHMSRLRDILLPRYLKGGQIRMDPRVVEEDDYKNPSDLYINPKFMPRVMVIFGRRGQGKTLWMTNMLYLMKLRYKKVGVNFRVFTNYQTSFSDYQSPTLLDELSEFPPWANNAIIGLDEIADLLPSSRAMSNHSVLSQSFFRQIRKRGCEVMCATQFPQEITRGLLRQVDWFVETSIIDKGQAIKTYWHDWWGQWTGQFKLRYWPPERAAHDYSFTLMGTDKMFGHYQTEEVIANTYSDSRQSIIDQQWSGESGNDADFLSVMQHVDRGSIVDISDLVPIAKAYMRRDYMSVTMLANILKRQGYIVEQESDGSYVVMRNMDR